MKGSKRGASGDAGQNGLVSSKQPLRQYDSFVGALNYEKDDEFSDDGIDWTECMEVVGDIGNQHLDESRPSPAPSVPQLPPTGAAAVHQETTGTHLSNTILGSHANADNQEPPLSVSIVPELSLRSEPVLNIISDAGTIDQIKPPPKAGPPPPALRTCTCVCTCGAAEHNHSLGYEPAAWVRTSTPSVSNLPQGLDLPRRSSSTSGESRTSGGMTILPPNLASSDEPAEERGPTLASITTFNDDPLNPSRNPPEATLRQDPPLHSHSTFSMTDASTSRTRPAHSDCECPDAPSNSKDLVTAPSAPEVPTNTSAVKAATGLSKTQGVTGNSSLDTPADRRAPQALDDTKSQDAGPSMTDQTNATAAEVSMEEKSKNEPSLSAQQQAVMDMVMDQKSLMFTGGAGTGKSVLVRAIVRKLKQTYNWDAAVAVCAMTGIAALHIGGQTLHSWSGVGLGNKPHDQLMQTIKTKSSKQRWLAVQVLLVDEVSMLDAVLFDKLERIAREMRSSPKPFGGIQLVLVGDFYQLPPVITTPTFFGPHDAQTKLKIQYQQLVGTYHSRFVFHAKTWDKCIPRTVILRKVFRQADQTFVRMLEETRRNELTPETIGKFYRLSRPLDINDGITPTELFPTRGQVNDANKNRLNELPGEVYKLASQDESYVHSHSQKFYTRSGNKEKDNSAQIKEYLDKHTLVPSVVELKTGAQVMLIKNLTNGLVNGSRGIVTEFREIKKDRVAQQPDGRCFLMVPNETPKRSRIKREVPAPRLVRKTRTTTDIHTRSSHSMTEASVVPAKCGMPNQADQESLIIDLNSEGPNPDTEEPSDEPGGASAVTRLDTIPSGKVSCTGNPTSASICGSPLFDGSDEWTEEEYETEEEEDIEDESSRIEIAVASGAKVQNDSWKPAPFRYFKDPSVKAEVNPGPTHLAKAGIKYPVVRFVDGKKVVMIPLKFDVESLVGGAEASRIQVGCHLFAPSAFLSVFC